MALLDDIAKIQILAYTADVFFKLFPGELFMEDDKSGWKAEYVKIALMPNTDETWAISMHYGFGNQDYKFLVYLQCFESNCGKIFLIDLGIISLDFWGMSKCEGICDAFNIYIDDDLEYAWNTYIDYNFEKKMNFLKKTGIDVGVKEFLADFADAVKKFGEENSRDFDGGELDLHRFFTRLTEGMECPENLFWRHLMPRRRACHGHKANQQAGQRNNQGIHL
jgi:hypothetical protein